MAESDEREDLKKQIIKMRESLDSQATEVLEYGEQLVRRLIEKVTVYEERFEVEFKSGMTVMWSDKSGECCENGTLQKCRVFS